MINLKLKTALDSVASEIKAIKANDVMDNLLWLFLILGPALSAFVFKFFYYDVYYWKAVSLYYCTVILFILLILRITIIKPRFNITIPWPVIILMGVVIISSLISPCRDKVLWGQVVFHEGTLTLISYYIIFIVSQYIIRTDDFIKRTAYMLFFIGAFIIYNSFIQEMFLDPYFLRLGGTFGHRNYLASYYTLLLLPAAGLYLFKKSLERKYLFFLAACIFFSALIAVHTRGAWVGNFLGFILFIVLARKLINYKRLAVLAITFVIIVSIINIWEGGLIFYRFNSLTNDVQTLSYSQSDKTHVGSSRYIIWKLSLDLIPKNYLFGAGPDMFQYIFPQEKYMSAVNSKDEQVANAHNEYLNMLLTIGIFGLLSYLTLIFMIAKKYLKVYRSNGINTQTSFLMLGVFCAWCAYLVQAFFNNSVLPTSPTLWAVMGMLWAYSDISRQKQISDENGVG